MDVRKEVEALIAAPSCCKEAKEAAKGYLAAIGTDRQASAAKALVDELKEDVLGIDDLIAFAGSEEEKNLFGAEGAAAMKTNAEKAKLAGEKYCTCWACQAGGKILDRANELK